MPIAGPQSLTVRQLSWSGPLARRDGLMALNPVRFSIVNGSTLPCQIETLTLDPVSRDGVGTTAEARLTLQAATDIAAPIPPGGSVNLILGGEVPAEPGAYASIARIAIHEGDSLAVPVALVIPASPVWGIAAMLCGLVLLGTVNLLAGEGSIKTQLHDALKARQDIHTVLEANPAPESRAGDVAAMDHAFDAAIATLGEHRRLSVVDHRAAEAQAELGAATKMADTIRSAVSGRPRGAAEIDDVRQDWKAMQPVLQQIASLPATVPATETGLPGKLDAFLLRFRQRLLQGPAAIVTAETVTELGRMALDESAGEGDAARDLALTTRLWLRRSAVFLNRALTSYRGALVQAGWMLNTDAAMRERAAHDDMAPEARQEILTDLDQAASQLDGDAWLENWKTANSWFDNAWTAQARGALQMAKLRVDETIATVNRQTDTGDIQALMAQAQAAPKPHTPAMKQAYLNQTLALWRVHVARLDEAAARDKFTREIDALQALVTAGRIMDTLTPYRVLLNDWAALNGHLVQRALDRLEHPGCLEIYADLQRNAARVEALLRERPPGPDMAGWDRQLDQIRLDMQRQGPDAETVTPNCRQPLLDIESRINALSASIFAATLTDIPLTALTRVRLAEASGIAEAMSATQANKDHPRTLVLDSITPVSERVVGRTLAFAVHGQDPVWGSSTTMQVDFGDHTAPFQASAEALRQGKQITHDYTAALTANLSVSATEAPTAGAPNGTILGAGATTILIAPSPLSGAQALADAFINLRFGLALLIALTVYYWRYNNRSSVFGARSYDYVEAFALGFAADAAVSNFPTVLKSFAPA
jgi:hypothetical protein